MSKDKAGLTPKRVFWVSLRVIVAMTLVAEVVREKFSCGRTALNIALAPLLAGAVWFVAWLGQKGRNKPTS